MEELKIIFFDENAEYDRESLKDLYDNNKTELVFNGYSEKEIKTNMGVLEQHKTITIKNYPYGYKRTNIRYWVETTKRGGRFCSQTLNPKTQKWNKPKKSTYSALKILVIDTTGKITTFSLDFNDDITKINLFKNLFKDFMNENQKIEFSRLKGYTKVMEQVEFKIKENYFKHKETGEITTHILLTEFNKYEKCDKDGNLINEEAEQQKQKDSEELINKAINYESREVFSKLKKEV